MFLSSTKHSNNTREIGNITENIACQHLSKNGLILVTRNFNQRIGEIDLIMKDKDNIVFIEVRYRKNINHGYPEETITFKKQKKIKSTALLFIAKHSEYKNFQPRFDVVAMTTDNNCKNNLSINWIQNAF